MKKLFLTQEQARQAAEQYANENGYTVEKSSCQLDNDFDIEDDAITNFAGETGAFRVYGGKTTDVFAWWDDRTMDEILKEEIENAKTLCELEDAVNRMWHYDREYFPQREIEKAVVNMGATLPDDDDPDYYVAKEGDDVLVMSERDDIAVEIVCI